MIAKRIFAPKMDQCRCFHQHPLFVGLCVCMSTSPCRPSSPGSRPPPPVCTPGSGRSRGTSARRRRSARPGPATCKCCLNLFKLLDDCIYTVSNISISINIFYRRPQPARAQVDINWSSSNLKTSGLTLMYYWRWLHSTQHVDTAHSWHLPTLSTLDFKSNVFYYLRILISS